MYNNDFRIDYHYSRLRNILYPLKLKRLRFSFNEMLSIQNQVFSLVSYL